MCRNFRCVLRMVHGASPPHNETRTTSAGTRRGLWPESGKHTDLSADREDCLLTWRRCHSYRYLSEVSCVPPAKHPSGFVLLISPSPRIPRTVAPLGDSCRPQCVFKNHFHNKSSIKQLFCWPETMQTALYNEGQYAQK